MVIWRGRVSIVKSHPEDHDRATAFCVEAPDSCTRRVHLPEMGPWSDVAMHDTSAANHCCVIGWRARCAMAIESRTETHSVPGAPLREAFSSLTIRAVIAFCCFEIAYYFAYRYGMSFSPTTASPFWFPDSVLL